MITAAAGGGGGEGVGERGGVFGSGGGGGGGSTVSEEARSKSGREGIPRMTRHTLPLTDHRYHAPDRFLRLPPVRSVCSVLASQLRKSTGSLCRSMMNRLPLADITA